MNMHYCLIWRLRWESTSLSLCHCSFACVPNMVFTLQAFHLEYYLLHTDWLTLLGATASPLGREVTHNDHCCKHATEDHRQWVLGTKTALLLKPLFVFYLSCVPVSFSQTPVCTKMCTHLSVKITTEVKKKKKTSHTTVSLITCSSFSVWCISFAPCMVGIPMDKIMHRILFMAVKNFLIWQKT